jgi:hypothetical protein
MTADQLVDAVAQRLLTLSTQPAPKALSKRAAAASLGVSVNYFEAHVLPELRVIRRGRRILVPTNELDRWLTDSAELTL